MSTAPLELPHYTALPSINHAPISWLSSSQEPDKSKEDDDGELVSKCTIIHIINCILIYGIVSEKLGPEFQETALIRFSRPENSNPSYLLSEQDVITEATDIGKHAA